jgi:hypothetical protein
LSLRYNNYIIIEIGDNFDAKYCNAQEKLGNNTLEKYEHYLRDETFRDAFKDFYYYFNDMEPNDKFNTKERKFFNPHLQIQSNLKITNVVSNNNNFNSFIGNQFFKLDNSGAVNINDNQSLHKNYASKESVVNNPKIAQDRAMSNIDSRFTKIKLMSNSGSTNSLIKNYRQSSGNNMISNNSTSNSSNSFNINAMGRRSGSTANINY